MPNENPNLVIDSFDGPFRFLSNFYPCQIVVGEWTFESTEAAYQAAKDLRPEIRARFVGVSANQSKKMGKAISSGGIVDLRPDWDERRIPIMRNLLRLKFARGSELATMLLSTGNAGLIEGNYWHDHFWGVCNGTGENWLGKLLMQRRNELSSVWSKTDAKFSVSLVRQHPDTIFVYGDNLQGWGKGGSAVIRDEPNAMGIPTKSYPSNDESSFLTDTTYEYNVQYIENAIEAIAARKFKHVLWAEGIGAGLADLPRRAPKTYKYLINRLEGLSK